MLLLILFLILYIPPDHVLVNPNRVYKISARPEGVAQYGFCFIFGKLLNNLIVSFPFNKPMKSDTDNFGGIELAI